MVRLVGWRGLGISGTEERRIKSLIDRHVQRVLSLVENIQDVSIRVKEASKEGHTHRYDVSVSVLADRHYHAQQTTWDLFAAVQRCFSAVEAQIKARHERDSVYGKALDAAYPEPLLRM